MATLHQKKISEALPPPLLKTTDFCFSMDTRPNENSALKIDFTPLNTTDPNILPLELNHIEFSILAYYCKGYPNEWSKCDVASVNDLQETRVFSFRPDNNGFRINMVMEVPTKGSYIITRRTIVFRNIDPTTIKAIGDAYDLYLVRKPSNLTAVDTDRNTHAYNPNT